MRAVLITEARCWGIKAEPSLKKKRGAASQKSVGRMMMQKSGVEKSGYHQPRAGVVWWWRRSVGQAKCCEGNERR